MSGEEASLWKLCCQAVDATIEQGTTFEGITIDRILRNLKQITSASEWQKGFLFDVVAKYYFANYLSSIEWRSGIKGKGVYFSEDSLQQVIREGLAINQEDLANSHKMKADQLQTKVVRNGTDGQIYNDTINIFEEKTLDTLVDEIRRIENE